jgi:hypothetical protein
MLRTLSSIVLALATACMAGPHLASAQESAFAPKAGSGVPQPVQAIDGGAGPCSVTPTVTADSKPVVAADVKVHIEYGFAGIRRLDLEAYTGNDGKVQFTGLPSRVHNPPLVFKASKDALAGTAVYNPESECKAQHEIVLLRKTQDQK